MEEIRVVFRDEEVLVLDKPAGWATTKENFSGMTVEEWLRDNFPNGLVREGIVHRLDKGTSGLVVVARKEEGLMRLKKQFKDRRVKKMYLALARGETAEKWDLRMPIKRSSRVFGKFAVEVGGKSAVTEFVRKAIYRINGRPFSLLEVFPQTGRTHQIRVHLSYLGWPIAGDRQYGGGVVAGLDRQFLHAAKISFDHPVSGEEMVFESKLPEDLEKLLIEEVKR